MESGKCSNVSFNILLQKDNVEFGNDASYTIQIS